MADVGNRLEGIERRSQVRCKHLVTVAIPGYQAGMAIAWDIRRSLLAWSVLLASVVPIGKPGLAHYDIPVNSTILGLSLRSNGSAYMLGCFNSLGLGGRERALWLGTSIARGHGCSLWIQCDKLARSISGQHQLSH